MRISDWSSDVCSSDLDRGGFHRLVAAITQRHLTLGIRLKERSRARMAIGRQPFEDLVTVIERGRHEIGGFIAGKAEHEDRKSVGSGKSVSVSVDIGGRRIIKKKKKKQKQLKLS